jgi:purine-binding chemotaxis protein CheW
MNDLTNQLPPEIDFSSFDFTNLANSFLPDEIKSKSIGEKYLVFFLGNESFAVPTSQIAEVAPPLPVTAVPNAPDWLKGIVNLRNEIVSVVLLPKLLGKPSPNAAASPKWKLVVLRSPDSSGSLLGFSADRLSEIISLRRDEITFQPDPNSPFTSGKAVHLSNHLTLIDAEKILSSLTVQ